ncbi:MAG: DUF1893 domain-containing protein [Clostridiales bacterium]|nr:DUF1893 domain-containing protein [Clostridiales bacterium]
MKDLTTAKNNLGAHTICLCKGGECLTDDKRGIAPMVGFISRGLDLNGYSVADRMVGKAVALLFVKCGISAVYAKTLSLSGKAVLEKFGIPVEYGALVEKVINRDGTDICPMEKTLKDCSDPEEAYVLIKNKLAELTAKNQ